MTKIPTTDTAKCTISLFFYVYFMSHLCNDTEFFFFGLNFRRKVPNTWLPLQLQHICPIRQSNSCDVVGGGKKFQAFQLETSCLVTHRHKHFLVQHQLAGSDCRFWLRDNTNISANENNNSHKRQRAAIREAGWCVSVGSRAAKG